jgi:hypothetical protein
MDEKIIKNIKRKAKENKLRVAYKQTGGLSEEEAQRKLNEVFDILLDEIDRRKEKKKQGWG